MSFQVVYTNTKIMPINNFDFVRLILWVCSRKAEDNIRVFESTTKLQKLVFIALHDDKEIEYLKNKNLYSDVPFEFVAEKFGPYSKDLTLVLRRMEKNQEIKINKQKGRQAEYLV